jgi:hypothetical protein
VRNLKGSALVLAVALVGGVLVVPATAGPYSSIAEAMVRNATPDVEAYRVDHGTYVGISPVKLRRYDSKLSSIEIGYASKDRYCIEASVLGSWFHVARVSSKPNGFATGATPCPRHA